MRTARWSLCIAASASAMLSVGSGVGAGEPRSSAVRWFGALRAMMHEGRTSAAVRIDDVVPGPATYAVGALSELRGEVTIVDDRVWYSYPDGDGFRTVADAEPSEGAALLVVARVESWEAVVLERDLTLRELEAEVAELVAAHDVPQGAPFAFRIKALFPQLALHVVDGTRLEPGASPREHHAASVQVEAHDVPATLVGFHSMSHQGVFTHHGETTHIHAVLADPLVTGHVDAVIVPRGAVLELARN